jgi:hypothetical protein
MQYEYQELDPSTLKTPDVIAALNVLGKSGWRVVLKDESGVYLLELEILPPVQAAQKPASPPPARTSAAPTKR